MSLRGALFQLHLWTGLTLGIVLAVLGLSGSVLVYHDELLALTQKPEPRAQAQGAMLSFDTLLAAARGSVDMKAANATFFVPRKSGDAAVVRFQSGRGRNGTNVFVDPASAGILDVRPTPTNAFISLMHDLHGRLLIPGREGRQVVGWLGVAMLVLGLSGIVIWWPKRGQWSAAFRVRRNARGYRLYRELHGAAGIWGLTVFLIVSFSGVAIAFPQTVRAIVTFGAPHAAPAFNPRNGPIVKPIADEQPLSLDASVALVNARYPHKAIRSVFLPAKRNAAWRVALGDRRDGPVTMAYVDPWRKKIVASSSAAAADSFMAWQRPLHEGGGAGAIWRFLVFLSGLLPSLFVTTGIVMWIRKRNVRVRVVQSARLERVDA
jgi:uncharacterized iron-regulated membrane protein